MNINIPLNAIGDPFAPWNQPEYYEGIPHKCDWDCGTEVDEAGQVCDPCLISNAEGCGDWDEDAAYALARVRTQELHERIKALEDGLRGIANVTDAPSETNTSHVDRCNWVARRARALLAPPISEAHAPTNPD